MRQDAADASEGDNVKRRLLIAAIFLLAGAVVNVGVAWGCAAWARTQFESIPKDQAARARWVQRHFSEEVKRTRRRTAIGIGRVKTVTESWTAWSAAVPSDQYLYGTERQHYVRVDHQSGWPVSAVKGSVKWPVRMSKQTSHYLGVETTGSTIASDPPQYQALVKLPFPGPPDPLPPEISVQDANRYLPLKPVWEGFALNTAFYATILWLLIPGPFVLRRFIRMKRGRCVKCGYPMGGSGVCSECGAALPSPKVVTP